MILGAQAHAGGPGPSVRITWPLEGEGFSTEIIKIQTETTDSDASIAEVQFFAGTNFIGKATNAPFNILWHLPITNCNDRFLTLTAAAIDSVGAKATSAPVEISRSCTQPEVNYVEIVAPADGSLFAEPGAFVFSADYLAGWGTARIQFLVGTNSAGVVYTTLSATAPPSSVTVSNLAEGEYRLSARDIQLGGPPAPTRSIRVVKLGLQYPSLTTNGRFQSQILTAFPGTQTIIQASANLRDWVSLSTNYPSSNAFIFTESAPATNAARFYRAVLPP
jgi:hypothetical protein